MMLTLVCVFSLTACATEDGGNGGKTGLIISKNKNGTFVVRDFVYAEGVLTDGTLDIGAVLEARGIASAKISAGAFDGDDKIKTLIVSDKVVEIEQGAFRNMKSLVTLEVPFVGKNAKTDAIEDQTLESVGKAVNKARTFSHFFGTAEYAEGRVMNNGYGDVYVPYTLRNVIVKATANVKYEALDKVGYAIGYSAFKNATVLESIKLEGENLKEIGVEAFSGCTGLKKITLPSSVKTVYESAFNGCVKLTDVMVEATNVVLQKSVFNGCTSMKKVNSQVDLTVNLACFATIGDNAFDFGREVEFSIRNRDELNDTALAKIFGDTKFKVV